MLYSRLYFWQKINETIQLFYYNYKSVYHGKMSLTNTKLQYTTCNVLLILMFNNGLVLYKLVNICNIATRISSYARCFVVLSRASFVYLWWLCSFFVFSSFSPDFPASVAALLCSQRQPPHPRSPLLPQETNRRLPAMTSCGDRRIITGRCPWQPTAR